MKKVLLTSILALLVTAGTTMKAQDRADEYLGLPGDNLNLYAVMNLFQESETLESFERSLNDENSRINNLDLNGDNYVDYISVNDYENGNVHTIVMQVALNPTDRQDVGVFTVERFRDGSVQIQLIGDEALYGRNYIIEPYYAETPNPAYNGRVRNDVVRTTYVEVAAWPMIRFIYQPHYVVWRSSWYWGYEPYWWHTWNPFYYHHYYGYHYNFYDQYYAHYRHWHTPRWQGYHNNYYSHVRIASPTVVININKGNYRQTYSRPESRRDGEIMYARAHSTRNSTLSNGTTRRNGSAVTTTTTRRAEGTTASESRSTRPVTSDSRSTARTSTSGSRSTEARPAGSSSNRSVSARPATSESRSTAARPSSPTSNRSVSARPASSESRSTAARPSSSTSDRSVSARPSSSENRSVARPSSAGRSTEARSSSSGPARNTAARSSGNSRQQSASSPRSSSRQSAPAAKSSNRNSGSSKSATTSSGKSENSKSRR